MQTRIKTETDPETKLKLRRFLRSITSAHKEVAAHAALLKKFEDAKAVEYDSIVAGNRDAITPGFFEYLQHVVVAEKEDPVRQEAVVKLGSQVATMVEAFERAAADEDAMQSAAEKFNVLLEVRFVHASN